MFTKCLFSVPDAGQAIVLKKFQERQINEGLDQLGIHVWVTLPDNQPIPTEVLTKAEGYQEWMVEVRWWTQVRVT